MRLQGKKAVITGAGQGIGFAIAEEFVSQGAEIIIAEINAEKGAEAAAKLGEKAHFVALDVTSKQSATSLAAHVANQFGHLDILVNNAGINVFTNPQETTEQDWQRCMAVDLEGVWRVSQALLNALLDREHNKTSTIINIASSHAFTIIPGTFPYPVAKHGLLGLTRSLGIEFAAKGMRVNAISPGYVETQLAVDYWNEQEDPETSRAETYAMHPPGRIAQPEEIAMTAVFLASDEATFINGANIVVDGGRSVLYHE